MALKKNTSLINFVLLAVLVLLLSFNETIILITSKALGMEGDAKEQINKDKKDNSGLAASGETGLTGDLAQDAIKLVISSGIPKVYGSELGVSFDFDKVQDSINIMAQFDPTYGQKKIVLTGDELKRYIDIGLRIACEYCCGATSIVFKDGEAACGCAHSQAMRGLAAYLIKNHDEEYSNDEILRELSRWKGMFFPKQMIQKIAQQLQNSNFTPDSAALVLGLKLPDYGKGSKTAPLPSEIENLPGMVGGC